MSPIRVNRYHAAGFYLIGNPSPVPLFRTIIADGDTVVKGYVAHHTSGEIVDDAYTAFSIAAVGINMAGVDNSADGEYAIICSFLPHLKWVVPSGDELLDQANIGTLVDLHDIGSIDPSDVTPIVVGFRIEEIDVSTGALAASSNYGYAMGHFETVDTTA